jgi:hypothetical protein
MSNNYVNKYLVITVDDCNDIRDLDLDNSIIDDVDEDTMDDVLNNNGNVDMDEDYVELVVVAKIVRVYKKRESDHPYVIDELACERK